MFGKGAEKYAERNWERGYDWSKSYGAMLRHLALWWQGEDKDPETGLPHIAHVAWHALVLTAFTQRIVGNDDRPCEFDRDGFGLDSMQAEVTNPEEIEAAKAEVEDRAPFAPGRVVEMTRGEFEKLRTTGQAETVDGKPVATFIS